MVFDTETLTRCAGLGILLGGGRRRTDYGRFKGGKVAAARCGFAIGGSCSFAKVASELGECRTRQIGRQRQITTILPQREVKRF